MLTYGRKDIAVSMWSRTKAALTHLEELLKCDLCHNVVSDPCNLGACDHYFCRSCLGPFIGKHCPSCLIPSYARDIQPYHLVAATVLHCAELRTLLDSCSDMPKNHDDEAAKDVDIVAKSDEQLVVSLTMEKENFPQESAPQSTREDVFEFNPTPPFRKMTRCRIPKLSKRRKITNNNKSWGIGSDISVVNENTSRQTTNKSSHKRVSFNSSLCSTPLSVCCPSSSTPNNLSRYNCSNGTPKLKENMATPTSTAAGNRWKSFTAEKLKSKHSSGNSSVLQVSDEATRSSINKFYDCDSTRTAVSAAQKADNKSSPASNTKKRVQVDFSDDGYAEVLTNAQNSVKSDSESVSITGTSESSTTFCAAGKRNSSEQTPFKTPNLNVSSNERLRKIHRTNGSPKLQSPENACKVTTDNNRTKKPESTFRRLSLDSCPSTPKARKINAKGETALHLESIKGNFEVVQKLLQQGENPNAKDNAGWTPLHEACNHGFKNIVVLLLDSGALINVPGMNNVTPLHDAVTNYHVEVVRLLVSRGADVTLRNRSGMTPKDYAQTNEMRQALESPVLPAPLPVVVGSSSSPTRMVFLSTGLSKEEREKLESCAKFLKAVIVWEFSSEVTHLIASCNKAGHCPRTLKYMHAVIAGKWIVRFDWIEACLNHNEHANEEQFEVEGSSSNPKSNSPRRARLNSAMQYPPIFDGCHFYFHGKYSNPIPSNAELTNLALSGGAQLLRREPKPSTLNVTVTAPYHATSSLKLCSHYVFYQKDVDEPIVKHNMERLKTLPVSWLLDSVAAFALLDPLPYYT